MHWLDLDDIHAPASLRGQPLEAHESWLRDILPNWLAKATLIVMATGSHGTMHSSGAHNYVPKLRIALWLSDPVSPTGFKRYAAEISKHIEATGVTFSGKSPLDLSIYSPERMLFFNAPEVHGGGSPFTGGRIAMLDDDGDATDEATAPELKMREVATKTASNVTELAPLLCGGDTDVINGIGEDGANETIFRLQARLGRRYEGNDVGLRQYLQDTILPALVARLVEVTPTDALPDRLARHNIDNLDRFFNRCKEVPLKDPRADRMTLIQPPQQRVQPQPVPHPDATINDVRRRLGDDLAKVLTSHNGGANPTVDIFAHKAGTAKTGMALAGCMLSVHRDHMYNIFAVPNRQLAAEVFERARRESVRYLMQDLGLNWRAAIDQTRARVLIKTRRYDHCTVEDGSYYGAAALQLEQLGRSPVKPVCLRCGGCDWPALRKSWHQAGTKDNPRARLVIMVHADLTTTLKQFKSGGDKLPDKIVIDESVIDESVIDTVSSGSANDIQPIKIMNKLQLGVAQGFKADIAAGRDLITGLVKLSPDGPLSWDAAMKHLMAVKDGLLIEQKLQTVLMKKIEKSFEQKRSLKSLRRLFSDIKLSQWWASIYKTIRTNSDVQRGEVFGLVKRNGSHLVCRPRARLPVGPDYVLLDGSIESADEVRCLFKPGVTISYHYEPAPVGAYNLTQVPSNFFSSNMLASAKNGGDQRSNILHLWRYISMLAHYHGDKGRRQHSAPCDVLVVCQKGVARLMPPLPRNVDILTFGKLRGNDSYRDAPAVVVIGRIAVPNEMLEMQAMTLQYDNTSVNEIKRLHGEYHCTRGTRRLKNGGALEVGCEAHPDQHCEVLRRMKSDDEVNQAINRLRLYDRDENNRADIHVFGTTDTGLEIGNYFDWGTVKEFASAQTMMAQCGVYYKNPSWAAKAYYGAKHIERPSGSVRDAVKAIWNEISIKDGKEAGVVSARESGRMPIRESKNNVTILNRHQVTLVLPRQLVSTKARLKASGYAQDVIINVGLHATSASARRVIKSQLGEVELCCVDFERRAESAAAIQPNHARRVIGFWPANIINCVKLQSMIA